jgi:hypothetical protein
MFGSVLTFFVLVYLSLLRQDFCVLAPCPSTEVLKLFEICLFEFIHVAGWGSTFMKHFKEGSSYRSLITTDLALHV